MTKVIPTQFESERLILRRTESGDGPALNEALLESYENLNQWMAWADHAPNVAESEEKAIASHERFNKGHEYQFLLIDKSTGLVAGSCGLHYWNEQYKTFEIGYWIRTRFLKQGLAKEAASAVANFAFKHNLTNQLEIHVASDNLVSQKVALSIGFEYERKIIASMRSLPDGPIVDELVFVKRKG
ncbi:MAG TPA: GNAT family N-acetyltransferase [Fimbriimonas sp.]|nr:GNAT family N-acetyltransferase [Fimbriimonas sp.]